MISKAAISEIKQLQQLKFRREHNLFVAEGVKVVAELLESGLRIKVIAATDEFTRTHERLLKGKEVIPVLEKELSRISGLQTPNQVVAIAEIPENVDPDFTRISSNILALDGIRDPGNMGTLIRTAEWFGLGHVICSNDCVDAFNPKVVQGAMGSLFRMKISYGNLAQFLQKAEGFIKLGAAADGIPYQENKFVKPWILVVGSESHGISPHLNSVIDQKISIPKSPAVKTESLNAAVAAGVLMAAFSQ